MSSKRPESVLVVVYTAAGEVLLLRRVRPAQFWQSVTGSMDWSENDPRRTALRELTEETGIIAPPERLIDCRVSNRFPIKPAWRYRYAPGVRHNLERVFRLCLDNRPPIRLDPAEHSEYCWLDRERALAKVTSYTNRDAIEQFVPG